MLKLKDPFLGVFLGKNKITFKLPSWENNAIDAKYLARHNKKMG